LKCPRCRAVTLDDGNVCPKCGHLLIADELCFDCRQRGELVRTNVKGLYTNGEPAISRFEIFGRTYLFYVRRCRVHGCYRAERKI